MRKSNRMLLLFIALLASIAVFTVSPSKVDAAAGYKKINVNRDYNPAMVKIGSRYFKMDSILDTYVCAKSAKADKWYYAGPQYTSYTNGTMVYCIDSGMLQQNNLETGERICLTSFNLDKAKYNWDIAGIYKKNIYLTAMGDNLKFRTYVFNLKTKKLTLVKKNCHLVEQSGAYFLAKKSYVGDGTPVTRYLMKYTSKGLKQVKLLGEYVSNAFFSNGKVYYAVSPNQNAKKLTFYRCDKNGKGVKKLGTVSGRYFMTTAKMNNKYARIYRNGQEYIYAYKTKKLRKV